MSETIGEPQESKIAETPAKAPNKGVWAIALILSAALAVTAINFVPAIFKVSAEYENIDTSASLEQLEAASKAHLLVEWKNSLFFYAIAGTCLAIPCIIASFRHSTRNALGASVSGLVFGALCGSLAVSVGTIISQQMRESGYDRESMTPDIIAWSAMSVVLALPAALSLVIGGEKFMSQKVMSIPLAGVLAGIAVTILVSLYMPSSNTSKLPPTGVELTSVWFGVLIGLILILSTFTGSRKPKAIAG